VFFVISGPVIFALFWWAFWGQAVGVSRWVVGRLRAGQVKDPGQKVDGGRTGMGSSAWKVE
jgi:hypothetical protein